MGPRSQNDLNKRLGNDFYLSWRVRGELGLAQSEEIEVGVLWAYIDESDIGGDDCVWWWRLVLLIASVYASRYATLTITTVSMRSGLISVFTKRAAEV